MLAVDMDGRRVLDVFLRPGSCSSNNGLDQLLRKIVVDSGQSAGDTFFHLDKGMTSGRGP
jgi:hypothetical protein